MVHEPNEFQVFTTQRTGSDVLITTSRLSLDFRPSANDFAFTAANLNVSFELNATHQGSWVPGMADTENLEGTLSSMDCYQDPAECAKSARSAIGAGLISKAGWVVVDDGRTPLWTDAKGSVTSNWTWWASPPASEGQIVCKGNASQPRRPWKVLKNTDWFGNNCVINPYGHGKNVEDCADQCAARCDCTAVSVWRSGSQAGGCNFKCKGSAPSSTNTALDAIIVRPDEPAGTSVGVSERTDQYLFAHGRRYTDALADFALVSGRMDMPPLSAFGIW